MQLQITFGSSLIFTEHLHSDMRHSPLSHMFPSGLQVVQPQSHWAQFPVQSVAVAQVQPLPT
jgi:hypothetical protein